MCGGGAVNCGAACCSRCALGLLEDAHAQGGREGRGTVQLAEGSKRWAGCVDDVGGARSPEYVVLCDAGGDMVWSPGQQFMLDLLVKSLVTEGVLEAAIRTSVSDGEGDAPSSDGLMDLVEQLLKMFTEKEIKQISLVSGSHPSHM